MLIKKQNFSQKWIWYKCPL